MLKTSPWGKRGDTHNRQDVFINISNNLKMTTNYLCASFQIFIATAYLCIWSGNSFIEIGLDINLEINVSLVSPFRGFIKGILP